MWPTPQVVMPDHTETRTLDEMGRMVTTSGDDYAMNLVEAVRLWPTPMSYSPGNTHAPGLTKLDIEVRGLYPGEKYGSKMWPTPLGSDGEKGGPNQRGGSGDLRLSSAVHLYPTPSSRDWKGPTKERRLRDGKVRRPCDDTLDQRVGGQLNPDFVEWLMNFPKGWTEV